MGIFNPEHDAGNPLNTAWQAILGGLNEIVRNYPKDRFGTKVPFSCTFHNPAPEVMTTVFNAFRNAFVKAFEGKLENEKVETAESRFQQNQRQAWFPVAATRAGNEPEDGFSGYPEFNGNGVARWGDYSAAAIDADGVTWMATEYTPDIARTVNANWCTYIIRLQR